MTRSVIPISAIALGVAAFVSLPLSPARAEMPAPSGTTSATSGTTSAPNAAPTPEGPAPTPSEGTASTPSAAAPTANTAASTGSETPAVQPPSRPHARHYARHTHGRRYAYYGYRHDPVAAVAGGLADLGSMVAYPIYCFPNYGSCPVYMPY